MPVDYSAKAVARRLRQVDDLRRTCLALASRSAQSFARESHAPYGSAREPINNKHFDRRDEGTPDAVRSSR